MVSSLSQNIPREWQQLGENQDLSFLKTLGETFSMTFWSRGTTRTEKEQLPEEATPQHILLQGNHRFPAKCQLGEEIKVNQGLAAAPVGSEFHTNPPSLCTSISHPLGMIHQGLHLLSPALAELFPSPTVLVSAAPPPAPFSSSARVRGCTWRPVQMSPRPSPEDDRVHKCSSTRCSLQPATSRS